MAFRILSIDVAFRTLAVCVIRIPAPSPDTTLDTTHTADCHCHPSWRDMEIQHWSTTDLLTMHGCKVKKITSVPCERLMHYMLNYFKQLLSQLEPGGPFTHILIERQMSKNKLSRYMSMCLYTFFFGVCGYQLEQTGKQKRLKVIRPEGSPMLEIVHAKHKLSVMPGVKDYKKTAKMTEYDERKALAVSKTDHLIHHLASIGKCSETAHAFWTGITRKDRKDDPADALLMALWVVERESKKKKK